MKNNFTIWREKVRQRLMDHVKTCSNCSLVEDTNGIVLYTLCAAAKNLNERLWIGEEEP